MYRIAVLSDCIKHGLRLAEQVEHYCRSKGLFPLIEHYQDQEQFFSVIYNKNPSSVILALKGVDGLNAAEHLRSLRPDCSIIWCSDLDFSLHAFRLKIDYFLLEPFEDENFQQALQVWFERKERCQFRSKQNMKENR